MTDQPAPKDAGEQRTQVPPNLFDSAWGLGHRYTTLIVFALILLALAAVAILYRPLFRKVQDVAELTGISDMQRASFAVGTTAAGDAVYYADIPPGGAMTDIFARPVSGTQATPTNLTNSPDYSEFLPAPDAAGERVAFFAVSRNGDRSLRVLRPGAGVVDVTYQGGDTRLGDKCKIDLALAPQWSPDGAWIAFLAECGEGKSIATELFAAKADGSEVKALSHGGNRVTGARWLDSSALLYSEKRGDGSGAILRVSVADAQPQPVLLATLNLPE